MAGDNVPWSAGAGVMACHARARHPYCGIHYCGLAAGHDGEHMAPCRRHHGCVVIWSETEVCQQRDGERRAVASVRRLGERTR